MGCLCTFTAISSLLNIRLLCCSNYIQRMVAALIVQGVNLDWHCWTQLQLQVA